MSEHARTKLRISYTSRLNEADQLGNLPRFCWTNDIPQTAVLRHIIEADIRVTLVTQVGVHDFSIRDLIKPESQRVKKILSAIINFAKFREEQLSVFDKHTERSVNSNNS